MVALSQPCSKLPMEAAMATSTAPPMAAEIYACTAACNKLITHQHTKSCKSETRAQKSSSLRRLKPKRKRALAYPPLWRPRFGIPPIGHGAAFLRGGGGAIAWNLERR